MAALDCLKCYHNCQLFNASSRKKLYMFSKIKFLLIRSIQVSLYFFSVTFSYDVTYRFSSSFGYTIYDSIAPIGNNIILVTSFKIYH